MKKIWINYYVYDTTDPDCADINRYRRDSIGWWANFMREMFREIVLWEADNTANIDCDEQRYKAYRIYWKACVDLNSIEVVGRPIVWCKFGNCCKEEYRVCRSSYGDIHIVSHTIENISYDRCQEEPGRECVPAMCE